MRIPLFSLDAVDIELLFLLVLLGLASYRMTVLITEDEILRPVREWIWKRFPPEKSLIGYALTCTKCISVWMSIISLLFFLIFPLETLVVAVVLAISGIVVIIDSALKR